MTEYTATESHRYPFSDGHIIHEIYDGTDTFQHRLVAIMQGSKFEGPWVPYEQFARVGYMCGNCEAVHVVFAAQDNWRPLFPPIFVLNIPDREDVPPTLVKDFVEFQTGKLNETVTSKLQ